MTSDALEMDYHKISTTSAAIDISKPSLPELDGGTLTEDKALAFLQHPDLPPEIIQKIAKNTDVMKLRKVRLAIAAHPRTARRLSLRLIRESHTGDLARFALLPAVAADIKKAAAELLLTRLPSITVGERISLARRSPPTVAAALLLDKENRVWQAVLENPRLTEAGIVKALHRHGASDALVAFLCRHAKWSFRPEIRAALLLTEKIPLAHALAFACTMPSEQLRDILHVSRLPRSVKAHLEETVLEKMP
ncbi:MAG TPA: hypothetical protein VIH89_02765 [Candidatus Sulfotelmatobacter sp.]